MDAPIRIECEEVYVTAVRGSYLSSDYQQVDPGHARILGQHVLKPLLKIERRRRQSLRSRIGHSPDRHFYSQLGSFLGVLPRDVGDSLVFG